MNRYIATWTQPDGSRLFSVEIQGSYEESVRVAKGRLGADDGKVWTSAVSVDVARETEEHNIPKLDPVSWAALTEQIKEMNRRMGRAR